MAEFFTKLDVEPGATPEQFAIAVRRYCTMFPVNGELLAEYKAYCRSRARASELDGEAVQRYAAMSGRVVAKSAPVLPKPTGAGIRVKRAR